MKTEEKTDLELMLNSIETMKQIVNDCKQMIHSRRYSSTVENTIVKMDGDLYLIVITKLNQVLGLYQVVGVDVTINPTRASHFNSEDAAVAAASARNGNGNEGLPMDAEEAYKYTVKKFSESIAHYEGEARKQKN